MTNEEAIEYNENLKAYMRITDKNSEYKFLEENYEALDMGIKALKQTMWIPVSEPPKKSGEYLLYGNFNDGDDNTIFIGGYEADYEKFGWWQEYYDHNTLASIDREFIDYANVLAWRELPQPYKAESEDE